MKITILAATAVLAAVPLLAGVARAPAHRAHAIDDVDVAVDSITSGPSGCVLRGWVVTVRESGRLIPGSQISASVPCSATAGDVDYLEMARQGQGKVVSLRLSRNRVVGIRSINRGLSEPGF
jgi:hypothetical protein